MVATARFSSAAPRRSATRERGYPEMNAAASAPACAPSAARRTRSRRCTSPTCRARSPPARGWEEVPQAYNVHHFTREGIFIQGQFVPPAMEAPVLPGVGTAHKAIMARYSRLGSFGALVSDESAGRVRAGRDRFPRVTYQLGVARP